MDFPTALKRVHYALKDQYKTGRVDESDQLFMFDLLKRGMIGMDGFKFCLVEEAKANREIILHQLGRKNGNKRMEQKESQVSPGVDAPVEGE